MVNIKKYVKEKYKGYQEERSEKKKYMKELNKEELTLRRKSFREQSLKEATKAGKRLAVRRANPQTKQKALAFFQQAEKVRRGVATSSTSGSYPVYKKSRSPTKKVKKKVKKKVVRRTVKKVRRGSLMEPTLDWSF